MSTRSPRRHAGGSSCREGSCPRTPRIDLGPVDVLVGGKVEDDVRPCPPQLRVEAPGFADVAKHVGDSVIRSTRPAVGDKRRLVAVQERHSSGRKPSEQRRQRTRRSTRRRPVISTRRPPKLLELEHRGDRVAGAAPLPVECRSLHLRRGRADRHLLGRGVNHPLDREVGSLHRLRARGSGSLISATMNRTSAPRPAHDAGRGRARRRRGAPRAIRLSVRDVRDLSLRPKLLDVAA